MIALTPLQQDALQEFINIGAGRAAGRLNELVVSRIQLHVPEVKMVPIRNLGAFSYHLSKGHQAYTVILPFDGECSGKAAFVITEKDSDQLLRTLVGDEYNASLKQDTVREIGNILINSLVGSLGDLLEVLLFFRPPEFYSDSILEVLLEEMNRHASTVCLMNTVQFDIQDQMVTGHVLLIFQNMDINVLVWKINQQISKKTDG